MQIPGMKSLINHSHWFIAMAVFCLLSTGSRAETDAANTAPAAINQNQADAILLELKGIRKVLEKIEKKSPAQPAKRQRPTSATVTLEKDRPVMGADDAPVTVVEFTDYQCPYCRRFTQTTFPLLQGDFCSASGNFMLRPFHHRYSSGIVNMDTSGTRRPHRPGR